MRDNSHPTVILEELLNNALPVRAYRVLKSALGFGSLTLEIDGDALTFTWYPSADWLTRWHTCGELLALSVVPDEVCRCQAREMRERYRQAVAGGRGTAEKPTLTTRTQGKARETCL